MKPLEGFSSGRWRDRYFGFVAFLAAMVSIHAVVQRDFKVASYWAAATILSLALVKRRFFVLAVASGFVSIQALFFSVTRGLAFGLVIAAVALGFAALMVVIGKKRKEAWPGLREDFDLRQVSIDLIVYFCMLLALIKLT
jgi:hypothetical protein